jgi:hypothetical protein
MDTFRINGEIHLTEDVPINIDPWRHFNQLDTGGCPLQHATFGYVVNRLSGLRGIIAAKRNLLDFRNELPG